MNELNGAPTKREQRSYVVLHVLAYMRDIDSPVPAQKIARDLDIDITSVRRLLNALVENDFVDYKTISTDHSKGRRCVHYVYVG